MPSTTLIDVPLAGSWDLNDLLRREHFAAGVFFWLAERLRANLLPEYGEAAVYVVRYPDEDLRGYPLKLSVSLLERDPEADLSEWTEELERKVEALSRSGSLAEYALYFAHHRRRIARELAALFP